MQRRQFLSGAALGAATLAVAPRAATAAAAKPARIIDTHTHFYDPSRPRGVPWPPANSKLYRTVLPDDWAAVAEPHGVTETVVVEASQWVEDNQWLLDLADQDQRLTGIVGNLDPLDPEFETNARRFSRHKRFRGVRWRGGLVDISQNPGQILAGARLLAELGLSLDINGNTATLPHIEKLAASVPDLRIIINHLGGPGDSTNPRDDWKEAIESVAKRPRVFMKVSALVEQTKSPEGGAPSELEPYLPVLDHLWSCFGGERLIYGSNWPVSDRGAPYSTVIHLVKTYFSARGAEASERYFWQNAVTAYGLP
jgi:L-fuconolactonase